jgi:hypothetical protein
MVIELEIIIYYGAFRRVPVFSVTYQQVVAAKTQPLTTASDFRATSYS